ncbi:MAG TPA: group 1 truncated hemoglobin [Methylomirabilota bacterium]|jgi:hemoglobin|nr:group 1 truncated hemoglobin [Methylomirabilota bacterium]
MRFLTRAILIPMAALTLTACASAPSDTASSAPATPTLYQRLGGREAIKQVVDDFVANLAADPRVNARFKGLDAAKMAKLQTDLADQICDVTGGPCAYLGRDMKTVHKGMNITEAEWNATVEDLVKTLNKFKVGPKEQQELLGALGGMKKDIVGQ